MEVYLKRLLVTIIIINNSVVYDTQSLKDSKNVEEKILGLFKTSRFVRSKMYLNLSFLTYGSLFINLTLEVEINLEKFLKRS